MQKQHRLFLLIITLVTATASIALCSNPTSARLQDSQYRLQSSQRDFAITQRIYKAASNRLPGLAVTENPSTFVTDYIPGNTPTLLFGRRANTHQSVKRFWNAGHVFAGATLYKPSVKPLHCLIFISTPTVASILEVPLNRGPTSNI